LHDSRRKNEKPWGGLWRFEFDRGTVIADNIDGQYGLFLAGDGRYKSLSALADESMAFDKSFNNSMNASRMARKPGPVELTTSC
jgi:hypothetical protein